MLIGSASQQAQKVIKAAEYFRCLPSLSAYINSSRSYPVLNDQTFFQIKDVVIEFIL